MAISGLQTINIGVENQATGSDSLYVAFTKAQNNFSRIANIGSPYNTFVGGNGIVTGTDPSTGTVTITNSGILNVISGTGITALNSNGNVTISVSGYANGNLVAGVTNVGIRSNTLTVSNSPVISNGIINVNLTSTGITPGQYVAPTVTVDTYGRVTSIANTASTGTVTEIAFDSGDGILIEGGPITTDGTITITNTGVTRLNAGPGIALSGSNGEVTVYSTNPSQGTVTSVEVTSNTLTITGSPITSSGTINIELPESDTMTGNFTAGNLTSSSALRVLGNANVVGTFLVSGASTLSANLLVTANANVTGNIIIGGAATSTGNLLVTANSNITGNAIFGGTVTSTGTLIASGNANVTGTLNVSGNSSVSGTTTSIGNLLVTANSNVTGNALFGGNVTSTGTLTASGNANVTGNLNVTANASVTGNFTSTANVSANNISVTRNLTVGNSTLGNLSSFDVRASNAMVIANTGYLILNCVGDNSKFVAFQGPATMSAAYAAWQLPNADGSANSFMSTNGAGILSFRQPASSTAPSTTSSTGIAGQIAYDSGFVYVCIATNTWRRAALTTW